MSSEETSMQQEIASPPPAIATKLIVGINVVVFIMMAAFTMGESLWQPSLQTLVNWGADYGPLTFGGQYWRTLTSCFVHAGLMHIAMNMVVLWRIGPSVEALFGTSKFLFIYLIAGLGGALVSLFFSPVIVSVGASGAVFGTFGAFLAYFQRHKNSFDPEAVKYATKFVITLLVYNLIFGLMAKGIDNAAHVGGFLSGLVAGFTMAPKQVFDRRWYIQDFFVGLTLLCLLAVLAYFSAEHLEALIHNSGQ